MKEKIIRVLVLVFVAVVVSGCPAPVSEAEQVREDCAPVFEWLEMCDSEAQ